MRTSRFLLLAVLILAIPASLFAQFGVSITIAPPALPVYDSAHDPRRRLYVDARLLGEWR
jgi:hypothetical protein